MYENYRLEQAKILMKIETFLLFIGYIRLDNEKIFPHWLHVLKPVEMTSSQKPYEVEVRNPRTEL